MSVSDFIFRNPGMDAQEILSLDTCCGFIPLTRVVHDDIVFSVPYFFSTSRGVQLEYFAQVVVSD
jgi:hypothetical protein